MMSVFSKKWTTLSLLFAPITWASKWPLRPSRGQTGRGGKKAKRPNDFPPLSLGLTSLFLFPLMTPPSLTGPLFLQGATWLQGDPYGRGIVFADCSVEVASTVTELWIWCQQKPFHDRTGHPVELSWQYLVHIQSIRYSLDKAVRKLPVNYL